MRVGLLSARSGPSALWRLGYEACGELAAAEINAAGGVKGAELELIHADGGATPEDAETAARRLAGKVDVLVGIQPSHQRNAVRRGLAGTAPYIYTPQYEGGWCGPSVTPLGVTDDEVLEPGIRFLAERFGARRFFFLGNDYVWPKVAFGEASNFVRAVGGAMSGVRLLPFGLEDYQGVFDAIRGARTDAVVAVLLGDEAVRFHRAFAEAGLARRIPRLSLACDETLLWAAGPENVENLFAGQSFFWNGPVGDRERVVDRYWAVYGRSRPPLNAMSLGAYDGVKLAAALAGAFDETHGPALVRRMGPRFGRREAMRLLGMREHDDGRPRVLLGEADGAEFRPLRGV